MGYKDKDKQREFQRLSQAKRRSDWIESQGGKCVTCGSTERLEVDHIDRDTKTMQPASIWSRRPEIRAEELAKCQVLCYVCHKEKTSKEAITPHGTIGRYSRGCRCELCTQCNRDRRNKQNKKS